MSMEQRVAVNSNSASGAQLRKIRKPLIERKRRERINDSLNQLKALVLEALCKDESTCSKMDKADILEMAVQHMRSMHHQHKTCTITRDQQQYASGFKQCANHVDSYFGSTAGVQSDLHGRLSRQLNRVVKAEPADVRAYGAVSPSLPVSASPYGARGACQSASPHLFETVQASFRPTVLSPTPTCESNTARHTYTPPTAPHRYHRTHSPQPGDDATTSATKLDDCLPEGAFKDSRSPDTDAAVWRPW